MLQQEMESHRAMMGDPQRFGNTLRLRDEAQDVWGWAWLDNLVRDVRLAVCALLRNRAYTAAAVASLAFGLALTASTAAVVNAYLIRSLPYPAANRLYHVMYAPPGPWEPRGLSGLDWKSVQDVVEFPVTSVGETFYLTEAAFTRSARGLRVTGGFIRGLGVAVVMGRSLTEDDFANGADRVAVLGHALWREQFGGDPHIIGVSTPHREALIKPH